MRIGFVKWLWRVVRKIWKKIDFGGKLRFWLVGQFWENWFWSELSGKTSNSLEMRYVETFVKGFWEWNGTIGNWVENGRKNEVLVSEILIKAISMLGGVVESLRIPNVSCEEA